MPHEIPERYRWAAERLDVRPGEQILEIGCGYGHMVGLVCERLTSGQLTAIDRSAKMSETAAARNAAHIASGRAEILHRDLLDSLLPPASFDKVFLFNINAFWMDPIAELAEVRRLLASEGVFHLFHLPPPGHDVEEFVDRFVFNFERNQFRVVSSRAEAVDGREIAYVMAAPNPR